MSDITDMLKEKGAKLSRWQTYTLFLILAFALVFVPLTSVFKSSNLNKTMDSVIESNTETIGALRELNSSIDKLQKAINLQNKNNLTFDEASYVYKMMFEKSKYRIIRMTMTTIVRNHIDYKYRQKIIEKTYNIAIPNLYVDDYNHLSKFKYNNKPLSTALDNIDPHDITHDVLKILFDSSLTHNQRRLDIVTTLDNQFNEYYQQSKKSLGNETK